MGILILVGMLYWSSLIIEKDMLSIRSELKELKKQIENIKCDQPHVTSYPTQESVLPLTQGRLTDEKYPNLLQNDLFFTRTLPSLLPPHFHPSGIRREALLGKPEHLHPFNGFRDVSNLWNLCSVFVAQNEFGKYETLSPFAATKIELRPRADLPQAHEYWIHLREGLYWQPLEAGFFPSQVTIASHFLQKHPVTAHDFKFFFDAVMNPNISEPKAASLRTYLSDIEEMKVIDDYTFVVRWKTQMVQDAPGITIPKVKYTALGLTGSLQPLPRFVFQYFADGKKIIEEDDDPETYRTNSIWAQNFANHFAKNIIIGCGPWLFDGMIEERVRLKRNKQFYDPKAVLTEGLQYSFKESIEAMWQDFKSEKIDLCPLAPAQQSELATFLASDTYREQAKKGLAIHELEYVDLAFYYVGWNAATVYFSNANVRKAMTMAIDRNRIIEQNLNDQGIPITGPFFRYSSSYDPAIDPWPYSPYEAKRLLEQEGWVDLNGDGIRDKMVDGKRVPFRFSLVYYAKNFSTKVICEYIAIALREIGVDCHLKGVDITDLSATFEEKKFDAIYMGWALGAPPENPRQLWHSDGAKEKGSSNAIGFAHPEIDQIIDSLDYEYDKTKRNALYHRFHKIIHEEQPYTFLFSPKKQLLYRDTVKNLFIPRDRQDLVPGADMMEPDFRVIWLEPKT